MSILARIRAHGGDIIQDKHRFTLKRGRLSNEAVEWLKARWLEACCEAWPDFDAWMERAAIREFDGGETRAEAEKWAFAEIQPC